LQDSTAHEKELQDRIKAMRERRPFLRRSWVEGFAVAAVPAVWAGFLVAKSIGDWLWERGDLVLYRWCHDHTTLVLVGPPWLAIILGSIAARRNEKSSWSLLITLFISWPLALLMSFAALIAGQGAPGRPLRVAGLRVLPRVQRGRVRPALAADAPWVDSLEPETRQVLAELWLADARAEYSSIKAFEYLARDLEVAKAPQELIDAARRAGLEEVGHATLCFAVASAYAGQRLAPSPLSSVLLAVKATRSKRSVSRQRHIERLAVESLVEGCIEEGLAARVALLGARHAKEPAIRQALRRIAREEATHADLAYAIVGWAVREQPSVMTALHRALERSRNHRRVSTESEDLLEWGRPGTALVDQLARGVSATAEIYLDSLARSFVCARGSVQ
jgi:hypothetical protein